MSDELIRWPIAFGQSFASKAVVDKIEVPEKYYRAIDEKLAELEQWNDIFVDVEVDKPHTWFSAGLSAMRALSEPMDTDAEVYENSPLQAFVDEHDLDQNTTSMTSKQFLLEVSQEVMSDSEVVLKTDIGIMMEYEVEECENNFYFFLRNSGGERQHERDTVFYLPRGEAKYDLVGQLSDIFWENKKIVKVGYEEDNSSYIREIDFDGREYEGPLTVLYDKLKMYIESDTRRCILFQGPPGTGKSTLAYNIAERVSKRTLVLSHDIIRSTNDREWDEIMDHLKPEMLLIDDIDRCARDMENKLHLFEDKHCDVPLIVLTSNDYSRLPPAFKRPGRVDQIIEMQDPPEKIRYEVIRSLGEQEGVDIPEEKMPVLDMIYQEYPGAYIVELLRRCDAEGWDYKIPEYGLTFKELSDKIIKAWNGEIDVDEVKESEIGKGNWKGKFDENPHTEGEGMMGGMSRMKDSRFPPEDFEPANQMGDAEVDITNNLKKDGDPIDED